MIIRHCFSDDEFPLKTMRSVLSQRDDERQGGLIRIRRSPPTMIPRMLKRGMLSTIEAYESSHAPASVDLETKLTYTISVEIMTRKSFQKSYSTSTISESDKDLPCTVIVGGFFGDEGKDETNRPLEAR
jgi:hypothetical protein